MDVGKSLRKLRKKKDKTDMSRKTVKKGGTKDSSSKSMRKRQNASARIKKKTTATHEKTHEKTIEGTIKEKGPKIYDVFDPYSFAFKVESTLSPAVADRKPAQKEAFEIFAKTVISQGVDGLVKEYSTEVQQFLPTGYYKRVAFDQNLKKNRYKDVVCNDITRVILKDGRPGDYIHANYIKGFKTNYILTQGPMTETIIDFWRMVVQENCDAICMLCDFMENGHKKCEVYYSEIAGKAMIFGDFTVTCESSKALDTHSILTMIVVVDNATQKRVKLAHYRIITWPDKTVAKSNLSILRVLRNVRILNNPVVVHCSAGIGRTGTFVAIEVMLQCVLNGKDVKLNDVARAIRYCRMNSVQMDTQYLMMAETVLDCGRAYNYIEDPQILESMTTFKAQINKYIIDHPPPIMPPKKAKEPGEKTEEKSNMEAKKQAIPGAPPNAPPIAPNFSPQAPNFSPNAAAPNFSPNAPNFSPNAPQISPNAPILPPASPNPPVQNMSPGVQSPGVDPNYRPQ